MKMDIEINRGSVSPLAGDFDLGAFIAPPRQREAQRGLSAMIPQSAKQGLALRLVRDEGKAGRPPRALPKPDDPFFAEEAERIGDPRAGVGAPLPRREIGTHGRLQLADMVAEGGEIAGRERRQRAVRDRARQRLDLTRGDFGPGLEGRAFACACEPFRRRIEDQEHAPRGRERNAGSELRQLALARPLVEHRPALREGGDADAGARASSEPCRDLARVEPEPFQRGESGTDGKRQLRAGAEPRVRRDRLLDSERVARFDAAARGALPEIAFGAFAFGSADRKPVSAREAQPGARSIEREPERAEGAGASSAWVEKAEM